MVVQTASPQRQARLNLCTSESILCGIWRVEFISGQLKLLQLKTFYGCSLSIVKKSASFLFVALYEVTQHSTNYTKLCFHVNIFTVFSSICMLLGNVFNKKQSALIFPKLCRGFWPGILPQIKAHSGRHWRSFLVWFKYSVQGDVVIQIAHWHLWKLLSLWGSGRNLRFWWPNT